MEKLEGSVVKQSNGINETNSATGSDKQWQKSEKKKQKKKKQMEPVYLLFISGKLLRTSYVLQKELTGMSIKTAN